LLLDPPAFGRGAGGAWRLDRDLEPLLRDAIGLLTAEAQFLLLNVYGLEASAAWAGGLLAGHLDAAGHPLSRCAVDASSLDLHTPEGRALPTGVYARVSQSERRAGDVGTRGPVETVA
jgi:hypothetical protein